MKRFFVFIFFISVLIGCKSKKEIIQPTEEVEVPEGIKETVIEEPEPDILNWSTGDEEDAFVLTSIKKGPCFGKCPVFEARVYSDGKVIYNGMRFVKKIGVFLSYIEEENIQQIIEKATSLAFFSLDEQYPTDGAKIVDFPTTITYFQHQGRELKIYNNHHAPTVLIEYEEFLIDFLDQLDWVKQ